MHVEMADDLLRSDESTKGRLDHNSNTSTSVHSTRRLRQLVVVDIVRGGVTCQDMWHLPTSICTFLDNGLVE